VTLPALRQRLVAVGSSLLVDTLAGGVDGLPAPEPQRGEPTIAEKITKEDLHLDWTQPAVQLARVVRLGRAWTTFRGTRLGVLAATADATGPAAGLLAPGVLHAAGVATGDGTLVLHRVQPESRSPMSAEEWLRGVRPADGEHLGTD
jgi:methionyl-tRNA formyltransferase